MKSFTQPTSEQTQSIASDRERGHSTGQLSFVDNRSATAAFGDLGGMMNNSSRARQLRAIGEMIDTSPHVTAQQHTIQRCRGIQQEDNSWNTVSTFDHTIRLDRDVDERKIGDGGALTVFKINTGMFDHRVVALEWFDGISQQGKEKVAHLDTEELHHGSTMSKVAKQIFSPFRSMTSHVRELPFRQDSAAREHRTVPLDEDQKETKRALIEGEIDKAYNYNLYTFSCKDWANQVAPEAIT